MNLQQMRDLVRTQLDVDESDLPNALIDSYLQEGYDRALELEMRWPFFETDWTISFDEQGIGVFPTNARVIELLVTSDGRLLKRIPMRLAVMSFAPSATGGSAVYWTQLGQTLSLLPGTGTASTGRAIGYRKGADWIAGGASTQCDCDRRLHIPICWYACSLGYAQQEDEVLEGTYLNRYKESTAQAREAIMRAWTGSPKQVGYTSYPAQPAGPGGPNQLIFQLPSP